MREFIELVAKDPEAVVERIAELDAAINTEREQRRAALREDIAARAVPLPLVDGTDWRALTSQLAAITKTVSDADGLTDLPAAVAALKAVVAEIDAAVISD